LREQQEFVSPILFRKTLQDCRCEARLRNTDREGGGEGKISQADSMGGIKGFKGGRYPSKLSFCEGKSSDLSDPQPSFVEHFQAVFKRCTARRAMILCDNEACGIIDRRNVPPNEIIEIPL